MRITRKLASLAIVAMLIPAAAFRNPPKPAPSPGTATMTSVPGNCAGCEAGISGSNGNYKASWSIGGACTSTNSCAMCLPTCDAGGVLNGTWSQAVAYYDANSCDEWACWETSPENLAALKAADPVALASAVKRHDGKVRYNAARQAIQVYDCRGLIAAHLPLPDEKATQLARLTQ